MVKCVFCSKNDTISYWDYYCDSCTKVKQFCKLIGSEKLCKSLQFKIKDSELQSTLDSKENEEEITQKNETKSEETEEKTEEKTKFDPQMPRKSHRRGLKNLVDHDTH